MADSEKVDSRKVELGTSGETVVRNIKKIRGERRISLRVLSELLTRIDHPISHSSLSQMETGRRKMYIDDFVAISIALGCSPAHLLMPPSETPDDEVDITGIEKVRAIDVYALLRADENEDGEIFRGWSRVGRPEWAPKIFGGEVSTREFLDLLRSQGVEVRYVSSSDELSDEGHGRGASHGDD